eukprot:1177079-Prorocentrum_minimum.AAC.12
MEAGVAAMGAGRVTGVVKRVVSGLQSRLCALSLARLGRARLIRYDSIISRLSWRVSRWQTQQIGSGCGVAVAVVAIAAIGSIARLQRVGP